MTNTKSISEAAQSTSSFLRLQHYSFGVGDRFAHQAKAQLHAIQLTAEKGVAVTPLWNKSNREHVIIGSEPASVMAAAQRSVVSASIWAIWNPPRSCRKTGEAEREKEFLSCHEPAKFSSASGRDRLKCIGEKRLPQNFAEPVERFI